MQSGTERQDTRTAGGDTCYTIANSVKDPPTIMRRASEAPLARDASAAPSPRNRATRPASLAAAPAATLLLTIPIALIACGERTPGLTQLTRNSDVDWFPAWPSDGSRIAFTSHRDGDPEIYVMNADGSNVTQLTNNSNWIWYSKWSPDGGKVAYLLGQEIYVMNADGSNITQLTNNSVYDGYPAWSPDGSKIAFTSTRDGDYEIYGDQEIEIYVMNADGSNVTQLTDNSDVDLGPAWSPDGSRIAFVSDRDGDWEIYVMDVD